MSEDNLEVVSQEMIDELASVESLDEILDYVYQRCGGSLPHVENYIYKNNYSNGTYLKIIQHLNGDLQFEAEKPKKWIVRSVNHDGENHYKYLIYSEDTDLPMYEIGYDFGPIVKFDTKEEAEKWTNPQTEVVEVEE